MKVTWLVVLAACSSSGPKQDTLPFERHLGQSTKSSGSDASKPAPVTPDDPRVMNVSASITPSQLQQAQAQGVPTQAPPSRESATSSTPVTPPADIAPPTTAAPEPNRPNVNSPPPPPPPRTP